MKFTLADGRPLHLGYCFNVLPGETPAALHQQLRDYCLPLRLRLGLDRMGVGLWIAAAAAKVLVEDHDQLAALRRAHDEAGLYVHTLNGFPYGGFHDARVKERVYRPSWAERDRRDYTEHLVDILAALLPNDVEVGTISTVPVGPAGTDLLRARRHLTAVSEHCKAVRKRTGREIRLCLEPEPGTAFERVDAMTAMIRDVQGDRGGSLGVCLDCCHAAVVAEDGAEAIAVAGAMCGKIQVSSALVCAHPELEDHRAELACFDEPRYLHQVRMGSGATLRGTMDIPEALADLETSAPWRVHFHVPVHRGDLGRFGTTRDSIVPVLAAAIAQPGPVPHIEVETYTWNVLPESERPTDAESLVEGLARELEWTAAQLESLGAVRTADTMPAEVENQL